MANVWARENDGLTIRFLMPIQLPAIPDEPAKDQVNRIFAALNQNDTFKSKLYHFVAHQLES